VTRRGLAADIARRRTEYHQAEDGRVTAGPPGVVDDRLAALGVPRCSKCKKGGLAAAIRLEPQITWLCPACAFKVMRLLDGGETR
jgi:hypothetical protein